MVEESMISQGITLAVLGWLLFAQYKHHGCTKRIEQKIDSFIQEYRNKPK